MGRKQSDIDRITELERKLELSQKAQQEAYENIKLLLQQIGDEQERYKLPQILVRCCEGGGLESFNGSLALTINKMLMTLRDYSVSIRKIKQWVKELPIEARVDMPELQS